jgi:hypothetical protein
VRVGRRFERRDDGRSLGVASDLVVKALNQLPCRAKPPRELRKELLHLVPARERRIGARLAVVVAEPLIILRRTIAVREWPDHRGCW